MTDYQRKLEQERLEAIQNRTDLQEEELKRIKALRDSEKERLDYTKDLSEVLLKNLKITNETGDNLERQTTAFRGIVNAFVPLNEKASALYKTMDSLSNPLLAGYELIKLSAERFAELDNAAQKFRDSTGFLASDTRQVETNIRVASRDLAQFGVSVEDAQLSAQQLAISFGDTAIANKENIEYVSLMSKNLGISADDSVSLMQNFMGIGGMTPQVARETAAVAASMAKAAGVPFGAVMKEVAKPSAEVRALVRGSVDALIKGAIEAKRLGTSLEAVGKAAAGMLDFQTSINDEMEASVLFGKDVNLQKARELSYAGDLEGLAKEQARLLREAGDVSKMDYFQRISIAKALGMTVEEMDKMNAKQKELNQLRIEDPETYEKLTAKQKVMDKTKESLSDKYKKELLSQQLASQQEKIMASINQIMTDISEILLPIVNGLIPIISILLKISSILVTLVLAPFRELNNLISYFSEKLMPGVDILKSISDFLNKIADFFRSNDAGRWVAGIVGTASLILAAFASNTWTSLLVNAITMPFKLSMLGINALTGNAMGKLKDSFIKYGTDIGQKFSEGMGKNILDKVSDIRGKLTEKLGSTAKESIAKTASESVTSKITSTVPMPTGGAAPTAGGGSSFINSVKSIDPKLLLSLGFAMIAFAGAVLILAHAAKVFGSPEAQAGFSYMAIAAVGLAVITAALVGLSTLITSASPVILPAIGMMLGFAAAVGILSLAAMGFGKAFQMFVEGFERAMNLNLFQLAAGFYVLSGAIISFGAAMAGGGMLSFMGGGLMLQLVALAAISPGLMTASVALSSIAGTLEMFKDEAVVEGIENITEAIKGLNKEINNVNLLNVAGLALLGGTAKGVAGGGGEGGGEIVDKLDELIDLMRSGGIAVNIDGSRATTLLGVSQKFRGSYGTT